MKLSIIVPVYNEEKSVQEVLEKLNVVSLGETVKEIIVVDDGSRDETARMVRETEKKIQGLALYQHEKNKGKGAAVKTGISHAKGDYIIIQDADTEYDPKFIKMLLTPVIKKKAEVVFGTRLKRMPNLRREERSALFLLHYVGNRMLSLITSFLYGQWITDMETCYKLFPKDAIDGMVLHARGFEFEPEITAKLMKKGYKILELPITTTPRGYSEGKKLHAGSDGAKALWALVKYRFVN